MRKDDDGQRDGTEGQESHQCLGFPKSLRPVVPQTLAGRLEMEEDLECIKCTGLLNKPWSLKDEGLVQELLLGVPNQFDLIVSGKP